MSKIVNIFKKIKRIKNERSYRYDSQEFIKSPVNSSVFLMHFHSQKDAGQYHCFFVSIKFTRKHTNMYALRIVISDEAWAHDREFTCIIVVIIVIIKECKFLWVVRKYLNDDRQKMIFFLISFSLSLLTWLFVRFVIHFSFARQIIEGDSLIC